MIVAKTWISDIISKCLNQILWCLPCHVISCDCCKNFDIGHYKQTFEPNSLMPAMLRDTIDVTILHHFQWLWLWQVTRSVQSKTCWIHFLAYKSTDQDDIWYGVETNQIEHPDTSFKWDLLNEGNGAGIAQLVVYKPRSSLCTHAFHRTDSKDPDVHVLDGWMPATKNTPSTHHPRRRNVTTLMVGLKNGHIRKNLTQKWWTPEI